MHCFSCVFLSLSRPMEVDIEHYIHDKSFHRRLILLSLSNSKIGRSVELPASYSFLRVGCVYVCL